MAVVSNSNNKWLLQFALEIHWFGQLQTFQIGLRMEWCASGKQQQQRQSGRPADKLWQMTMPHCIIMCTCVCQCRKSEQRSPLLLLLLANKSSVYYGIETVDVYLRDLARFLAPCSSWFSFRHIFVGAYSPKRKQIFRLEFIGSRARLFHNKIERINGCEGA